MYTYPDAGFRFAEREFATARKADDSGSGSGSGSGSRAIVKGHDVTDEDIVCEGLAWSRALACLRRAFGVGGNWAVVDIETVWERYWALLLEEMGRKEGRHGWEGGNYGDALSEGILELVSAGDEGHEGEVGVNCVPTRAGGMFLFVFSFPFYLAIVYGY